MSLTDNDIKDFADIWEREFGERLTPDQARIEANNLLELAWRLSVPLPDERIDQRVQSPHAQ